MSFSMSPNFPKSVFILPSQTDRDSLRSSIRMHELIHGGVGDAVVEMHYSRMRNLRKELDYLKDTEWKYEPIEKYIGQA